MNSQANASAGVSRLPAPGFSRLKAPTVTFSKVQAPQDQDQVFSNQDIPNQTITQKTQQLQKPTNFSEKSIPTPSQGRFSLQTPKTTTSKFRNESSGPDLTFQNQVYNKGTSSAIGRGSNIKMPESAQNQHKGNNVEKVKTDQQNNETPKLQSKKGIPLSTTKIETNQPVQPQKKLESGIGKGLTNLKPVTPSKLTIQQPSKPQQAQGSHKVDQDQDQSPNHQAKANPEQDSKQPRRAMSTFPSTKFGFKGGSNATLTQSTSKPLESQPREEEGIHIPSVMSPVKQGTAEIHKVDNRHHNQYPPGRLSVTRQTKREELSRTQIKRGNEQSRSKSANRMAAIVNTIENAKLEETIKKLEFNIQQLPTQFNRTSRLKEFTPLVSKNKIPEPQSQQQQMQLPLQNIPVLHDPPQHTQNSLKNRLSALRDEKKLAKIQNLDCHAPHPEYSNLQRKFDEVIHGGLHSHSVQLPPPFQEEERNLPLSAFKKPIPIRHSLIQQDPFELLALVDKDPFAPAGDADTHPPLLIEEEDLLLVDEVKAEDEDNPFQVVEQMSCHQ